MAVTPPEALSSGQAGRRQALVVQNNAGNRTSRTTIVALMTSQERPKRYPFHVPVTVVESGLRRNGLVMCEQLLTLDQTRLESLAGALRPDRMLEVDLALHRSLGLRD